MNETENNASRLSSALSLDELREITDRACHLLHKYCSEPDTELGVAAKDLARLLDDRKSLVGLLWDIVDSGKQAFVDMGLSFDYLESQLQALSPRKVEPLPPSQYEKVKSAFDLLKEYTQRLETQAYDPKDEKPHPIWAKINGLVEGEVPGV